VAGHSCRHGTRHHARGMIAYFLIFYHRLIVRCHSRPILWPPYLAGVKNSFPGVLSGVRAVI
jgi:hypothetical protein